MAGEVLIGTCGWTDKTLIEAGTFYPKTARSSEERLRYYSEQFPLVEVDSTYYAPPSEQNAVRWLERTPPGFTFNIKAYSLLTNHPTRPDSLPKDLRERVPSDQATKRNLYRDRLPESLIDEVWTRFRSALLPLHSAGKLGAVLFQFPQWFIIGRRSKDYIVECARRMEDMRIAVEFRHSSWLSDDHRNKTLNFLEANELPLVCVDMPQGFESSVPPVVAATAGDLAMVRFHGRNTSTWEAKGLSAAERFAYLYEQPELAEWVPRIESLASSARETHVLMNNCYRDYAVNNARQLAQMILPGTAG